MAVAFSTGGSGTMRSDFMISDAALPMRIKEALDKCGKDERFAEILGGLGGTGTANAPKAPDSPMDSVSEFRRFVEAVASGEIKADDIPRDAFSDEAVKEIAKLVGVNRKPAADNPQDDPEAQELVAEIIAVLTTVQQTSVPDDKTDELSELIAQPVEAVEAAAESAAVNTAEPVSFSEVRPAQTMRSAQTVTEPEEETAEQVTASVVTEDVAAPAAEEIPDKAEAPDVIAAEQVTAETERTEAAPDVALPTEESARTVQTTAVTEVPKAAQVTAKAKSQAVPEADNEAEGYVPAEVGKTDDAADVPVSARPQVVLSRPAGFGRMEINRSAESVTAEVPEETKAVQQTEMPEAPATAQQEVIPDVQRQTEAVQTADQSEAVQPADNDRDVKPVKADTAVKTDKADVQAPTETDNVVIRTAEGQEARQDGDALNSGNETAQQTAAAGTDAVYEAVRSEGFVTVSESASRENVPAEDAKELPQEKPAEQLPTANTSGHERVISKTEEFDMIRSAAKPAQNTGTEQMTEQAGLLSADRPVVLTRADGEKVFVKPADVAEQITKKLIGEAVKLQRGRTEYTVTLNPEELGKITVRLIKAADGAVSVSIAAENAHTLRILQQNSAEMQASLKNSGVQLENWQTVGESEKETYAQDYQGSSKNPYQRQQEQQQEQRDGESFADIIAAM